MAKKTVFTGVINDEMFDNVTAYNARMNELVEAGVEDITASSSTEIKFEEDTTDKYTTTTTLDVDDVGLSIYPYMCEDKPFYLDLLVTDDPVTNQEAYTEAQNVLKKCYDYTLDSVKDWCLCERETYINDLDEIINDIDDDIRDTLNAIDKVGAKRKRLEESYHKELDKLNKEMDLLEAADRVSDMFKNYYSDVRDRVNAMNIEEECSCCGKSCTNDVIETTVTEKEPQTEWDFNKLMDAIFGPGLIRTRR